MASPPGSPAGPRGAPADERQLIESARGGDEAAYQRLVETYRDRVVGLAFRMVGAREDAEEIAQDAFVRAWRALPAFRGEARFSTWLYRIAIHRCYDARKSLVARRVRETDLDAAGEYEGVDGRASAARFDAGRRLEPLIAALPAAQRAAVTLFYYDERSIEEVALAMGVPEGTVKTHLHRARAALREAWQRESA